VSGGGYRMSLFYPPAERGHRGKTTEHEDGTEVTMLFEDIPPGIRPEDNEAGTRSSLEKLARYVESGG